MARGAGIRTTARGFEKEVLCLVDVSLFVDFVVYLVVEVALPLDERPPSSLK